MLIDTDVLVWALRGHRKAAEVIDAAEARHVSVITYMELIQGARNQKEIGMIRRFLADVECQMAPLSENIGHRAAIYMEQLSAKTGLHMGDALLAATAVETQLPLCTANRKHYKAIAELELKPFRP